MTFSRAHKGAYMDLLMAQFNNGHLPLEDVRHILAGDYETMWESKLKAKFKEDDAGRFFNQKLENEIVKRKNYTQSRKDNLMGSHKENGNDNDNGLGNKKRKKKTVLPEPKEENPFKEIWRGAIDAWMRLLKMVSDGGKFSKGDGTALKEILGRCQQKLEANEADNGPNQVLEFWQTFLGTWDKWQKFHKQPRLPFINSQFDTIYADLKSGTTARGNGPGSINKQELTDRLMQLAKEKFGGT